MWKGTSNLVNRGAPVNLFQVGVEETDPRYKVPADRRGRNTKADSKVLLRQIETKGSETGSSKDQVSSFGCVFLELYPSS